MEDLEAFDALMSEVSRLRMQVDLLLEVVSQLQVGERPPWYEGSHAELLEAEAESTRHVWGRR